MYYDYKQEEGQAGPEHYEEENHAAAAAAGGHEVTKEAEATRALLSLSLLQQPPPHAIHLDTSSTINPKKRKAGKVGRVCPHPSQVYKATMITTITSLTLLLLLLLLPVVLNTQWSQ